jgi:GDP-L-fucose synthase
MATKGEVPVSQQRFHLAGKRVWVAGHRGMVGTALVRRLVREDCEILTVTRTQCDLLRQAAVERWMADTRPEVVLVAAAKVGGILANATSPAEFLHDNLMIEANVIDAAYRAGVEKFLFFGSSCIYPKLAPQPMKEEYLLEGQLEPSNQWYAVAKIAGVKLCQAYRRQYGCDFISAMPTNLYGPGDDFDLLSSHVVPALIAKVHAAKTAGAAEVEVWGTGRPRREFLHVDDLADACVRLLEVYSDEAPINVGCGTDLTIAELADKVQTVVGFEGRLRFDLERPDGAPRKLLDISRLSALGWRPRIGLDEGLAATYRWYLDHVALSAPCIFTDRGSNDDVARRRCS